MDKQTTPSTEAELQSVVAALFERFPTLIGFSVQDAEQQEGDLCLAEVSLFPPNAGRAELMGEIAVPLLELLDEAPDARELLCGRTFARALH